MNNILKISVIIPTYNRLNKGLIKCIYSVLNQKTKPYEIIIVDDGSTDGTRDYFEKKIFPKKIIYHFIKHTGNPAYVRNYGIKRSKGNYIAFIDSDDVWLKHKLFEQIKIIKNKKYKFVCSNAYLSNNHHQYFNSFFFNIDTDSLFYSNKIINSSVLIEKELLLKSNLYPESKLFYAIEDYALWIKLSIFNKFFYINEPLLIYSNNNRDRISLKNNNLKIFLQFINLIFFSIFLLIKKNKINLLLKLIRSIYSKILNKFKSYLFIFYKKLFQINKKTYFKNKVSIIMPVHNSEKYLAEAIESILNQTHKNFEFLIMDDCSNDKTSEIIEFYKKLDPRIISFKNNKKKGISFSLNKLIKKTRGDFIARMDSDDISKLNRINYQLNFLKNNNKVDVLSNGIEYFGYSKKTVKYNRPSLSAQNLKTILFFFNPINHPTILFRRKIKYLFKYQSKNNGFEDWILWINLIYQGINIYCDKKTLLKYRIHKNINTTKFNKQNLIDFMNLEIKRHLNLKKIISFEFNEFKNDCFHKYLNQFKTDKFNHDLNDISVYNKVLTNKIFIIFKFKFMIKNFLTIFKIICKRYFFKETYY